MTTLSTPSPEVQKEPPLLYYLRSFGQYIRNSALDIYCAGALGGLLLGFSDLLINPQAAGVVKIAEGFGLLFNSTGLVEDGVFAALMLVGALGACTCWINRPQKRYDALARGLSAFALLNLSPIQTPDAASLGLNSPPTVEEEVVAPISLVRADVQPSEAPDIAVLGLRLVSGTEELRDIRAHVVIRDPATAALLTRVHQHGQPIHLKVPAGTVRVEIEVPGYRSVKFTVSLAAHRTYGYRVNLTPSALPQGVQKLMGLQKVVPVEDTTLVRGG